MKKIVIPLFCFLYAIVLTIFYIPIFIFSNLFILFWTFDIKEFKKYCHIDYFDEDLMPYCSRGYYKSFFHAIWNRK